MAVIREHRGEREALALWRGLTGPGRVVLESLGTGRWTILAVAPVAEIRWREGVELVRGDHVEKIAGDPFDAIREALRRVQPPAVERVEPFGGGAIGWLSYELGRRLEPGKLPGARADVDPPLWFGIYDAALVLDRETSGVQLRGVSDEAIERLEARIAPVPPCADAGTGPVAATSTDAESAYVRGVARIREWIAAGDLYQANLSARFSARTTCGVDALWPRLRSTSPEPFAACLEAEGRVVLSASMERLLSVRAGVVETRPIKGTVARSPGADADAKAKAALLASEKDRAELLMIVDLHRNDLGKVCVPGSVEVPVLFDAKTFAHVHHLEATVRGRLREDADALDALRAVFPAGSITGAPKIRAMQVIEDLEPASRGVYCGAIGYLGFDGSADFSVAIRTAVLEKNLLRWSAGGGIVWDSDPAAEWREVLAKSAGMRRLAEGS